MIWFRTSQSPATLLSRIERHRPHGGDIVAGGVRSRVPKDPSWIESDFERAYVRRHLTDSLGFLPSRSKHIICTPFINFRSIMTRISVDEQEVIKAFDLFLSTVKGAAIPMNEMCRIYIESLCRSSNISTAVYLLSYLHDRDIHVNLDNYNILLEASSEASNFNSNLFSEIFKNLLLSGQPPDSSSYVTVANAFQKMSDSDQLLEFVREISELTIHRDPSVMNRIIFVTAKSGQFDKSIMIYEHLKKFGGKMDKVTFNTVLAMFGRAGRVDQMLSEFKLMKDLGYAPDIVTYNTLINCLRRLGRLDLCKAFTREMVERGTKLDLRTYTALIDGFGRAGHVKEALKLFNEMKNSLHPSIYVYQALISDLKKVGKVELALSLLEEMNSSASQLIGPTDFKQKKGRRNIRREREGNLDNIMNAID